MPRNKIDVQQIDFSEVVSQNVSVSGSLTIEGRTIFQAEENVNKKAISFDGTDDHIVVSDQDDFSFTDGSNDQPFSVSAWVYVGDVSTDNGPFVAKANFTTGDTEWLFKHANGKLQLFLYDKDGSASGHYIRALGDSIVLSDTTWHHVVATYDGSESQTGINLYVDNSVAASTKSTAGPYVRMRNTGTPLTIGATEDLANANRVFEDRIADVVIFNKELSSTEVTEIYNSGRVMNVRNHSAFTNVVSWWKMGDDQDTTGTSGVVDYVGGYNGTLTSGSAIVNDTVLLSDRIDSITSNASGSIAIGLETPEAILHIYGDTKIEGDTAITGSLTVTKASTILSDLTISGSQLKVTSTGPTSLYLQADTDNVTETDTAFIKMTQDGQYLTSYLGYTPNDSQDPEGGSLTDGLANSLIMSCHNSFPGGPPASSRIQFATEQAVRMTIEDDGKVGIGTTTPGAELEVSGDTIVSGSLSFEDYMILSVTADNTDIQTGTGQMTFRVPFAMELYQIPRASLSTASTSGAVTVDINNGGSTIFSTNLTIDANESTSTTAATAAVLSQTSIADDAQITVDVDGAGTGARGLKITLYYRRIV